jgi:hypothetical protein
VYTGLFRLLRFTGSHKDDRPVEGLKHMARRKRNQDGKKRVMNTLLGVLASNVADNASNMVADISGSALCRIVQRG